MFTDTYELLRFFRDGGSIHCSDLASRNDLLYWLEDHGFRLGFRYEEYKDTDFYYVYMIDDEIHMGWDPDQEDGPRMECDDILQKADVDVPDMSELPDIMTLLCTA